MQVLRGLKKCEPEPGPLNQFDDLDYRALDLGPVGDASASSREVTSVVADLIRQQWVTARQFNRAK